MQKTEHMFYRTDVLRPARIPEFSDQLSRESGRPGFPSRAPDNPRTAKNFFSLSIQYKKSAREEVSKILGVGIETWGPLVILEPFFTWAGPAGRLRR